MFQNKNKNKNFCKQIQINGNKKATGVEVDRFGQKLNLRSRKEIVLSAGAIGSPHILLLSGIGPKDQLRFHGIEVKHDLPGVGENLQDHIMTSFWIHSTDNEQRRLGMSPFETVNPVHHLKYLLWGKGPLVSNGVEAGAFFDSGVNNDSWRRPDLQLHTFSAKFSIDFGLKYKSAFNFDDTFFYGTYGDFQDGLAKKYAKYCTAINVVSVEKA